jgi:trimethylamine corrinoid protein
MEPIEGLKQAVVAYDAKGAADAARQAVAEGVDLLAALDAMTEVLKDIGERYGCGELWLPDLVGAAHAAQAAMPIIDAEIARTGQQTKRLGTVVVGTVEGDIHDIGKAMVASLLTAHGFKVIDLGTDVATSRFVEAVKEHEADILALSALLTTTAAQQQKVIAAVKEAGLRDNVKILVGGGAVNSDFAKHIGADGYGDTAAEGVEKAKELLGL